MSDLSPSSPSSPSSAAGAASSPPAADDNKTDDGGAPPAVDDKMKPWVLKKDGTVKSLTDSHLVASNIHIFERDAKLPKTPPLRDPLRPSSKRSSYLLKHVNPPADVSADQSLSSPQPVAADKKDDKDEDKHRMQAASGVAIHLHEDFAAKHNEIMSSSKAEIVNFEPDSGSFSMLTFADASQVEDAALSSKIRARAEDSLEPEGSSQSKLGEPLTDAGLKEFNLTGAISEEEMKAGPSKSSFAEPTSTSEQDLELNKVKATLKETRAQLVATQAEVAPEISISEFLQRCDAQQEDIIKSFTSSPDAALRDMKHLQLSMRKLTDDLVSSAKQQPPKEGASKSSGKTSSSTWQRVVVAMSIMIALIWVTRRYKNRAENLRTSRL